MYQKEMEKRFEHDLKLIKPALEARHLGFDERDIHIAAVLILELYEYRKAEGPFAYGPIDEIALDHQLTDLLDFDERHKLNGIAVTLAEDGLLKGENWLSFCVTTEGARLVEAALNKTRHGLFARIKASASKFLMNPYSVKIIGGSIAGFVVIILALWLGLK